MNGASSSSNPPPPAPASLLAPGFRFHPTDEELVSYYLKGKVSGRPLFDAISEIDLYKSEPWDLPAMSHLRSRDLEWYFFSPLDRKYANRSRTNRATMQGYWKTTGKDRPIQRGSRTVGMKKTLVFHAGRAPNGQRTNWVMHEYRLDDEELANANIPQDGYVVCRIFQKKAAGPQNGAQYGAPFVEEEWEAGEFVTATEGGSGGVVTTADEYLQISDFEQNQDQGNQPESTVRLAASSDVHPEDPFSLEEMFQDPSFINGIPQLQDTPNQDDDGYMELNDLLNPVDEDHHSSEYPILGTSNGQIVGDEEIDLPVEEDFFTAMNENTKIGSNESYLEPNDVLNPMAGDLPSDQTAEDSSTFYDATGFNISFDQDNFVQMNDLPYLPMDDSGFKSVDDIMAYFDSTDNNLHYSTLPEEFNFSPEVDAVSPSETSMERASSSSDKPEPEMGKRKGVGVRRAVMGRIENMLGSITAPPANAELVSAASAKSLGLMTAPSSVRVTAGMIEIRGFKVMGRAEHWSMDKSGDTRFLLSCGVSSPGGFEPVTKIQGWTMSVAVMLRGGFYFFFLSAMLLALCLKIGMRVCSR